MEQSIYELYMEQVNPQDTREIMQAEDTLTALEKAPGTFGNKLWWAVIAALVSGLVAYELTMLLH